MPFKEFLPYLLVMAGVTYLVRVIPLTLFHKKIKSRFVNSFLYYTPYAVLSAMTFPAILYATSNVFSGIAGLLAALLLAYKNKSLITVACGACLAVFAVEMVMMLI
ncbi:MAG: AzlD domain-containing protein [Clostridia bacterium]|nr:AzlD domain-containing protein [Clostridia bacterium]